MVIHYQEDAEHKRHEDSSKSPWSRILTVFDIYLRFVFNIYLRFFVRWLRGRIVQIAFPVSADCVHCNQVFDLVFQERRACFQRFNDLKWWLLLAKSILIKEFQHRPNVFVLPAAPPSASLRISPPYRLARTRNKTCCTPLFPSMQGHSPA